MGRLKKDQNEEEAVRRGRGREEGIHELQNAIIGICPRGITIRRGWTCLRVGGDASVPGV